MISDTHNDHRSLNVPDGDILIHGGDYTCYGNIAHAKDFNEWIGELPHRYKIVISGNHEAKLDSKKLISNATVLCGESVSIKFDDGRVLKFYGTSFFYPMKEGCNNPYYDMIDDDTNVLITHCPVYGYADGNKGCKTLLNTCKRLKDLKLVVCGHIHYAYGQAQGNFPLSNVMFVNAANCGDERKVSHEPIVIDL
jgi:3',5'-cyclic AMP phosphodiesterase CpdA